MKPFAKPAVRGLGPAPESWGLHAKFFQGLADPTRLRIVRMLLRGPHTVGALVAKLHVSQSGISNHLACLKWCGYATSERAGRCIVYSISDARVRSLIETAEAIVADNAKRIAACSRIRAATPKQNRREREG
jgi:DNA-binding transcriptional ArsR family regulator